MTHPERHPVRRACAWTAGVLSTSALLLVGGAWAALTFFDLDNTWS
ncbi:hypothetical protein AB0K45_09515 [Micrococcus luteus]